MSLVSLVTYTEGIPEFLRFRIHSVYVKEASHSCPHHCAPSFQALINIQSKLTVLQTPPCSDLKCTNCMKRKHDMIENKRLLGTLRLLYH